ncbi:hypothetical protein LCGC14_0235580 [marine sediment metagenome]|uniref:Helicase ATP-binding domain-containing protein n=1 Tax=marine sediment metagenome TaxID=412755 RepID=A0A0F9UQA7_9ZZZZ
MKNPKDLTEKEVKSILWGVDFKTKPLHHQAVSLIWAADAGKRIAYWHDIGTGKTLTSLYTHQLWGTRRLLVVCPNSVVEGWEQQIAEHTDQSYHLLRGSKTERRAMIQNNGDIWIVNYEGLRVLFGDYHGEGKEKRWLLNRHLIKEAEFDGIVFDEMHHLAHSKTIQSKAAVALSSSAVHVIGMTGTPISTGEADLWAEYYALDGGETLGTGIMAFLRKYFEQDYWGKWRIKKDELENILERISPTTLRYSRDECFDLPERMYEERYCDMTAEQKKLTQEIIGDKTIDSRNKGNKFSQVAGGFLIKRTGTTRLKKNPKLDELKEVIRGMVGKGIVFHAYIEEGRMIEERLTKMGIGHAGIRGEVKDQAAELRRFKSDPKCRVLVAHPRSGGEGLNLQHASTAIFYGNGTFGAGVRSQAEGRIWRLGQEQECLYIDLLCRDSVDELRLDRVESQAEIAEKVTSWVEKHGG